ncbi:MAG: HIT domain-containing protein [Candidatus Aenigmatarchaeota archaeon]
MKSISMAEECIFCKIAKKEAPAYIVYEDDVSIAFLDINPLTEGHILLIPKRHYERLVLMPEDEIKEFAKSLKNVLKIVEEKLSPNYNIIVNNGSIQEIFHAHIHIVPRYGKERIFMWNAHKLTEEEAKRVLSKVKS